MVFAGITLIKVNFVGEYHAEVGKTLHLGWNVYHCLFADFGMAERLRASSSRCCRNPSCPNGPICVG